MDIDWTMAPSWADRHVWDHRGNGAWLGWRVNDWVNTYSMWESESEPSGIPPPEGMSRLECTELAIRRP